VDLPLAVRAGEAVGDDVLDHVQEEVDLDRVALAEIVDRDDVDGDVVDAKLAAPAQHGVDVLGAVAVADAGVG
jgi:hypothetical protein